MDRRRIVIRPPKKHTDGRAALSDQGVLLSHSQFCAVPAPLVSRILDYRPDPGQQFVVRIPAGLYRLWFVAYSVDQVTEALVIK